jgi:hypothetical protein
MKRSGNRRQTFGTGVGTFFRNCPNREQELAGFFREISRNAGRYPQLLQARCCPHRRAHRHRREYRDARGFPLPTRMLSRRVSHPRRTAYGGVLRFRTRARSRRVGAGQGPRLRAPRLARQCLHHAPLDRQKPTLFRCGRIHVLWIFDDQRARAAVRQPQELVLSTP